MVELQYQQVQVLYQLSGHQSIAVFIAGTIHTDTPSLQVRAGGGQPDSLLRVCHPSTFAVRMSCPGIDEMTDFTRDFPYQNHLVENVQ